MTSANAGVLREMRTLFEVGMLGGLSDRQLLERFASRKDEAAFEALVGRHGPKVLRVCRRVLLAPDGAEDAFQATFLVLARRGGTLGGAGSLGSWLFGVARRTALKARTGAARRRHERRSAQRTPEGFTPDAFGRA